MIKTFKGMFLLVGMLAVCAVGNSLVAHAALTFGSSTIIGDSGMIVDATGTISIGSSTATGITIGNQSATTTIAGSLTVSSLIGPSAQCLQTNASGVISGAGSVCGAFDGLAATPMKVYATTYCAPGSTNCVQMKFDGKTATDLVTTINSPVVTCADCNFSSADVGKVAWATTNARAGGTVLPQSTIISVQSATQATMSNNAPATVTFPDVFVWATDDTAAWDTFTNLVGTNCAAGIIGPGMSLFTHAEFYNHSGCTTPNIFQTVTFEGQYPGTYLLIPPNFDLTTCTHGTANNVCLFGNAGGYVDDMHIWGGGYEGTGVTVSSTYMVEMGQGTRFENTGLVGFGSSITGLTGLIDNSIQGVLLQSGVNYFGKVEMECHSIGCISIGTQFGGGTQSVLIDSGDWLQSIDDTYTGGTGTTASTAMVDDNGTLTCDGCIMEAPASTDNVYVNTSARLIASDHAVINQSNVGATAIHALTGSTVDLANSIIDASPSSNMFNIASGAIVNDEGGNSFKVGSGNAYYSGVSGTVYGSLSLASTQVTTSSIVLGTGFSSSTVTQAGGSSVNMSFTISLTGSPTSSAVAAVTFPNAFLAAPYCLHNEAGTQTLTNAVISSTTNLGLDITYNGSLATGNTIVETLHCEN